ncbi:hypothetical protein PPYR_14504 [Photinus pyralis]|uniref:Protein quiver n=1 Tax=Photinus pyralis TaxID=7054 RepID=A0A5N4A5E7_PHOPY|nr:uncharacterized protein LOC116180191 [Photinus pyralis]KAB0792545.1 hypothetical protein PPYR_14504 [Photinus pyralis]
MASKVMLVLFVVVPYAASALECISCTNKYDSDCTSGQSQNYQTCVDLSMHGATAWCVSASFLNTWVLPLEILHNRSCYWMKEEDRDDICKNLGQFYKNVTQCNYCNTDRCNNSPMI